MTDPTKLNFNRPVPVGNELQYMSEAIAGEKLSGDGPFTKKCSTLLEKELGVPKVLLTTSCTHALEMMPMLLDIQPGDEVILPSFTFVSTVNAFVLRGAKPVFADIRPDTLNLDENQAGSADHPAHKSHRAGALCRRGLRDGRASWRSPNGTASRWWKTMPMGCSANTRGDTWARLERWRRRPSTRPRISPAARAARC